MLQNLFENIGQYTQKGKNFHFLKSTVDSFDSFMLVSNKVTNKGSHIRDNFDVRRSMWIVVVALIPALLFGMYNVGYQHYLSLELPQNTWNCFAFGFFKVFPIWLVAYIVGRVIEIICAQMRHEKVNEGFWVTGLLITLILPPDVPLWMVAIATAFAVIFGKEVFGGTGMNIWNPALLARAFIFISYPSKMSGNSVWIADKVDVYSGATTLSRLGLGDIANMPNINELFVGLMPGCIGETSKIAILIGAVILLMTGVASLKIMFSVVAGGLLTGLLFNSIGGASPMLSVPAFDYLLMGGFMFGAVFMATDPVTSSQTKSGKWIYGLLIGALAIVIRVLNPYYNEGMMFAILIMNTFVPLIDYIVIKNHKKNRKKRIEVYNNLI
ncbi:Na(+)-translocating NADH-quinone reductase subunit B [Bacteroidia bacterium]|nr:Na(+)-translocating NADH-quinone reductase subunit B [Bacteroidia bacterium]